MSIYATLWSKDDAQINELLRIIARFDRAQ